MGNAVFGGCTGAPPSTSFRSILDEKGKLCDPVRPSKLTHTAILVSPNSCFKDHLARVNDIAEFHKKYTVGKLLGEGITGQVRLVTSIADNQVYAMKSLNLDKMDENQIYELRREIETLRSLDHPNIISLMQVYQSPENIYIIMEPCSGTDLGHRKLKSEAEVCSIVYQLTEAVAHCHYMNVVHRDLKLENIMFASESSDSIRLIDFGLSKRFLTRADIIAGEKRLNSRVMQTACGTAFYMAPEMLKSSYSEKADIWAIGVITYMILTGRPPFDGVNEKQVFTKLKKGNVNYTDPVWKKLSPGALEFVKKMLSFDPNKRPSAKEALELTWLASFERKRNTDLQRSERGKVLAQSVCNSVIHFATYPKLKRLALISVAHHLREKDTRELRDFFLILDEEHSGLLNFEEMHSILQEHCGLKIEKEDFQLAFNEMDQELEGNVHHSEFLAAALESQVHVTPELLNQAFDDFTRDGSSYIDSEALQSMMGSKYTLAQAEEMLAQCWKYIDLPMSDKGLSRQDFLLLMSQSRPCTPMSSSLSLPNAAAAAVAGGKEEEEEEQVAAAVASGKGEEEEEQMAAVGSFGLAIAQASAAATTDTVEEREEQENKAPQDAQSPTT